MSMSYDSALISSTADMVKLTGVQDLANLSDDSELVLADFLLEAHRWVFRWLEADPPRGLGIDPTLLTNQTRLESAIAYEACHRLAVAGYLDGLESAEGYKAKRDDELRMFKPATTEADQDDTELGAPSFGNYDARSGYDPEDEYSPWIPRKGPEYS